MGKVLLCTGDYAKTPYSFEELGVKIYSIEELCYVLKENAFFLDRSIVNKRLVKWIDEELKLPKLAAALYPLLQKKTDPGTFTGIILTYVHLYENNVIKKTETIYREGNGLNNYEKQKNRLDYLLEEGRYNTVIREYDKLLTQLPKEDKNLRAAVLHNKGVAYCRLFWFGEAAREFHEAYELTGDEEYLLRFLSAKRMQLPEKEYIAFVTDNPAYFEVSMKLEKMMEALKEEWQQCEKKKETDELILKKLTEEVSDYYRQVDQKISLLQNEYRSNVAY